MSSDKEPVVGRKEIPVTPIENVIVDTERATVPADFVKCSIDTEVGFCTFIFFRRRFNPKQTKQGIQLDTIDNEDFLEVKVPLNTAFALTVYMYEVLKEIRANPKQKISHFGPVAFRQEEEKK